MTFRGTLAQVNASLATITYSPTANYNGSASLTITSNDLGSTGSGGAKTDIDVVSITVNATNDAPAGTDDTVTIDEDRSHTFVAADFGFTIRSMRPANGFAERDHHHPAGGRLAEPRWRAVVAGDLVLVSELGNLVFSPAANANGAATPASPSRCRTTAAPPTAAIDLDPTAEHDHHQRHQRQRRAGRHRQHRHHLKTAPTPSRPPTSASAIRRQPANSFAAVKITTLPGAGSLTLNGVGRDAGPVDQRGRHQRRQAARSARRPTPTAAATPSFTFQVQDDGGTANGGVDLDPSAQHDHHQRHRVNDAPAGTDNTVTTRKTAPTPSRPPTSASPIRATARPTAFAGGEDHHPAGRRHAAASTAWPSTPGQLDQRGRHHCRQPARSRRRQRQRRGLRQLHLPGAGRRRHRQRRRRPRPDAPTRSRSTSPRQRCAGRHRTTRSPSLEDTRLHLRRRRLRLQRPDRQPGQQPAGGEDHHACPAAGTLHAQRRRGDARPGRSAWPTSAAGNCSFTPAANANGAAYASFTFQVQDDGGTANGGVDLDPTRQHADHQRHQRQRRAGGQRTTRSPRWKTRPTPSLPPTSASPTRATARPTAFASVKITTLPAPAR